MSVIRPQQDWLAHRRIVTNSNQTLVLVPTELELRRLEDQGGIAADLGSLNLCGFGPIAAAARTAQLLAALQPERVLLVGIAGSYDTNQHAVGTALEFSRVSVEGIGAGEGESAKGPPALGFPQWPGSEGTTAHPILDEIALATSEGPELLTTCSASDSPEHAALRRKRHPNAAAEDMEGFAVAMACALHGVPLRIVRGISNQVGDREPANWRIPLALGAARELAAKILQSNSGWIEMATKNLA